MFLRNLAFSIFVFAFLGGMPHSSAAEALPGTTLKDRIVKAFESRPDGNLVAQLLAEAGTTYQENESFRSFIARTAEKVDGNLSLRLFAVRVLQNALIEKDDRASKPLQTLARSYFFSDRTASDESSRPDLEAISALIRWAKTSVAPAFFWDLAKQGPAKIPEAIKVEAILARAEIREGTLRFETREILLDSQIKEGELTRAAAQASKMIGDTDAIYGISTRMAEVTQSPDLAKYYEEIKTYLVELKHQALKGACEVNLQQSSDRQNVNPQIATESSPQ